MRRRGVHAFPAALAALLLTCAWSHGASAEGSDWSLGISAGPSAPYVYEVVQLSDWSYDETFDSAPFVSVDVRRRLTRNLALVGGVGYVHFDSPFGILCAESCPPDESVTLTAQYLPISLGLRGSVSPLRSLPVTVFAEAAPTLCMTRWALEDTRRGQTSFGRIVPGLRVGVGLEAPVLSNVAFSVSWTHLSSADIRTTGLPYLWNGTAKGLSQSSAFMAGFSVGL